MKQSNSDSAHRFHVIGQNDEVPPGVTGWGVYEPDTDMFDGWYSSKAVAIQMALVWDVVRDGYRHTLIMHADHPSLHDAPPEKRLEQFLKDDVENLRKRIRGIV